MHCLSQFFIGSESLSTESLLEWPKDEMVTSGHVRRIRQMSETLEMNAPLNVSAVARLYVA
jgi:hypothetical protein